ncbi:MAG: hypothetical protein WBF17_23410, partial [Phycisphaerae bacterium]
MALARTAVARALAVCLVSAGVASSQTTRTWTGTLNDDWFVADNWSPNTPPVAENDHFILTSQGVYRPTFTGTFTLRDEGVIELNGFLASMTGETLVVGGYLDSNDQDAHLTLTGHLSCELDELIVSNHPANRGHVTVSNDASLIVYGPNSIVFGAESPAELTVDTTGELHTLGPVEVGAGQFGSTTVLVTGADSRWHAHDETVTFGKRSPGEVTVSDGGRLWTGEAILSDLAGGAGDVLVTGAGSSWTTSRAAVTVGRTSTASLRVTEGATVTTGSVEVGHFAGSTLNELTVDGAGSTLDTSGEALVLGHEGTGSLAVTNGGQLLTGGVEVAATDLSIGNQLEVSGAGSVWGANGPMCIGREGTATFHIQSGGEVRVAEDLNIGALSSVTVQDGTLEFGWFGALWEGDLYFNAGTLRVTQGDVIIGPGQYFGSSLALSADQTLHVDQTLEIQPVGTATVTAGQELIAGTLRNDGEMTVEAGGTMTVTTELENNAVLDIDGGRVRGSGTLVNGISGRLVAWGTIDTDFDNLGDTTLGGALTCTGTLRNYGDLSVSSGCTLRTDDALHNYGRLDLRGGSVSGDGTMTNHAGGIITGGSGVSVPLTNDGGLIHATSYGPPVAVLLITDFSGGNLNGGELRIDDNCAINVLTAVSNDGLISLNGPDAQLLGEGMIENVGEIYGQGRVTHGIDNYGAIRVVESGTMLVTGPNTVNHASGIIELLDGSMLQATQGLATNDGGITLHDATFDNVGRAMDSNGSISGSGRLWINALTNHGHIGVGEGDLSLSGALDNEGTVGIEDGRTLTIYGAVSGSGTFSGGTVVMLGSVSPGSSPGRLTFTGNVRLGEAARLEIELAQPGGPQDSLEVGGDLEFDGALSLSWLPVPGDPNSKFGGAYNILSYGGTRTGIFDGIDCRMAAYLDT